MLFRREILAGIADGRIDRVFRVWARPRVRAGSTQRTWAGIIVIDSVTAVTPEDITEEDAPRSGFDNRAALLTALSKSTKEGGYHRVMLHLGGPDPRSELAADADLTDRELAGIKTALDTIDARGRRAPWTGEVLRLIAEHPACAPGTWPDTWAATNSRSRRTSAASRTSASPKAWKPATASPRAARRSWPTCAPRPNELSPQAPAPPSTGTIAPVTMDARSLSSHTAASATSRGSAIRPIGVAAVLASMMPGVAASHVSIISVAVPPGVMPFTRMP